MLITAFVHILPEGYREPRNEVGSVSPVERLVGFESGTFRFFLLRLNPLGHSPQILQRALPSKKKGTEVVFTTQSNFEEKLFAKIVNGFQLLIFPQKAPS